MAARCPVCGRGKLFAGVLKFRERCDVCDADFTALEAADDGPAIIVIFLVGIFIVPFPVLLSVLKGWPTWLSLGLFIPIIILVSVGLLRVLRGVMFTQAWNRKAIERRYKNKK
jgi:uncharacterized protein (DUF983 family)